jgi:hypothetical protein
MRQNAIKKALTDVKASVFIKGLFLTTVKRGHFNIIQQDFSFAGF